MAKIQFDLDPLLVEKARAKAKSQGVILKTKADVIRYVLEMYVK